MKKKSKLKVASAKKPIEKVDCPFCHVQIGKLGLDQHIKFKHAEVSQGHGADSSSNILPLSPGPDVENSKPPGVDVAPPPLDEVASASSSLSLEEPEKVSLPTLPRVVAREEKAPDVFNEKFLLNVVDVILNAVAQKRGDFWKLTSDEKELIGEPLTKVTNKYVGKWIGKYSDEAMLLTAVATVFLGKYLMDRERNAGKPFLVPANGTVTNEPGPVDEVLPQNNINFAQGLPNTELLRDKFPGL